MANVAIIGGGAAGIGAAMALAKAGMRVSLFESATRLGGHCHGVSVSLRDRRTVTVDAGITDFCHSACPQLASLFDELNLRCEAADRDISVMTPDGTTIWFSRGDQLTFRRTLVDQQSFIDDIRRFGETCLEVLEDPTYAEWTASRYLYAKQYCEEFQRLFFYPQVQGWVPIADKTPDQYLIWNLVAAWQMLGIAGPGARTRAYVRGGMHTYCEAVEKWLRDHRVALHLSTQVTGVRRLGSGVRLRATNREKADVTYSFDHIILATGSDDVLPLIEDAVEEETQIFSRFQTRPIRVVVHHDPRLLPSDRACWGAYNYVAAPDPASDVPQTVTLYVNRLQDLPASVPDVFITVNPVREPESDKITTDHIFALPVSGGGLDAAREVDAMQGKRRTWFCGAYLREPFLHEQAYRCGLDCARRLTEAVADESLRFESGTSTPEGSFDDFLREIPLFADLDPRALAVLQLAARPFQLDSGAMLFRQGDPPDGLYLIKHGQIDVHGRVFGDDMVRLAELGRGSLVGEMGVLDHQPRSANAIAAAPTSGYFISSESFQVLEADFRPPAFAVMDCFRREVTRRVRRVIANMAACTATPPAVIERHQAAEWPAASSPWSVDESVVRCLPLFRTFKASDLREFIEPLKRYDFDPGQIVYAAGERPRSCLLIVRGAISMILPNEAAAAFAVRGPGQLIGEIALLDGGPQPLDCIVREPTIAFELDRVRFDLLRRGGSVLALRFFDAVTSSIVAMLRKGSAHMARLTAERRVMAAATAPASFTACTTGLT